MRGKVVSTNTVDSDDRITPAYAGKRTYTQPAGAFSQDHPRVCGEKGGALITEDGVEGSPPRMRGKAFLHRTFIHQVGITPAYAGKRVNRSRIKTREWDHPRVCGEKSFKSVHPFTQEGSPPRMRGKATGPPRSRGPGGITPAYAGKSLGAARPARAVEDHPRVCGEKQMLAQAGRYWVGSPPRMRGKAMVLIYQRTLIRITPAYAGKRLKRSHSIGHFSCILCLFHSVLHRASASGGSRAGPCAPPCLPAQNTVSV